MIENLQPEILELLKELNRKSDPMVPTTIRIDSDLEQELREFCDATDIKLGVLLRTLISIGWKASKASPESKASR